MFRKQRIRENSQNTSIVYQEKLRSSRISLTFKMADSETGLTDLMDDLDLEETYDTGYEEDIDVEIINGFYYQNVAFMDEKVQLFADYWVKLYLNCCLQWSYAVELLNDKIPEEAEVVLHD